VAWVGDWSEDPGDDAVMARAFSEERVLVTLDKDFGELAVALGRQHCGIVRLVNIPARQQASLCHRVLSTHAEALRTGAIITAEAQRLRVRLP
jgi:predicted nuclease of predicted toxin-antitoxin system